MRFVLAAIITIYLNSTASAQAIGEWTGRKYDKISSANIAKTIQDYVARCKPQRFTDIAAYTVQPSRNEAIFSLFVYCKQGTEEKIKVGVVVRNLEQPDEVIQNVLSSPGERVVIGTYIGPVQSNIYHLYVMEKRE